MASCCSKYRGIVTVFQALFLGTMMTLNLPMTCMMQSDQCWKAWIVKWKMIRFERSVAYCTVLDSSMRTYYF